tara:strand:- start:618 stop:1307 length:690 start_codon:yes stop_codon:yes gene_type:complete
MKAALGTFTVKAPIKTKKKSNSKMKAVYIHINNRTGEVCYVGAGTYDRPYDMRIRSEEHKAMQKADGMTVEIIKRNLTIEVAKKLEKETILYYGLENLLNKSLKCIGFHSTPPSKEAKAKQSATMKALWKAGRENDSNFAMSDKLKAHHESLKKMTDEQVESIIDEVTTRLSLGNISPGDLDIELATRYNVSSGTILKIRVRKGARYSKYPQTLSKKRVGNGKCTYTKI